MLLGKSKAYDLLMFFLAGNARKVKKKIETTFVMSLRVIMGPLVSFLLISFWWMSDTLTQLFFTDLTCALNLWDCLSFSISFLSLHTEPGGSNL